MVTTALGAITPACLLPRSGRGFAGVFWALALFADLAFLTGALSLGLPNFLLQLAGVF
jgi:hypothetical protein